MCDAGLSKSRDHVVYSCSWLFARQLLDVSHYASSHLLTSFRATPGECGWGFRFAVLECEDFVARILVSLRQQRKDDFRD